MVPVKTMPCCKHGPDAFAHNAASQRRDDHDWPGVQVPHAADRLQQAGQQAQLMSQPSDAAGQVESAAHREAHAQNRLKTKVIAELQNHKIQLAGSSTFHYLLTSAFDTKPRKRSAIVVRI